MMCNKLNVPSKNGVLMAGDLRRSRRWELALAQQKDEMRMYVKQMYIGTQSMNGWEVVTALSSLKRLFDYIYRSCIA